MQLKGIFSQLLTKKYNVCNLIFKQLKKLFFGFGLLFMQPGLALVHAVFSQVAHFLSQLLVPLCLL